LTDEQHIVINTLGQPIHVTLTKTSKGTYNWEVSVHGKDIDETLRLTQQADGYLRAKFGDEKA
jgi:hypothetical protein